MEWLYMLIAGTAWIAGLILGVWIENRRTSPSKPELVYALRSPVLDSEES